MNDRELKHYGILGMKWGVRRFQNPDGSYTAAGKERYAGRTHKSMGRSSSSAKSYKLSEKERKKLASKMKADVAVQKKLSLSERTTKSPFTESKENAWPRSVKKNTVYDEIHQSLKDARSEFEKKNKILSDYWSDERLVEQYRRKAAKLSWEKYGKKYGTSLDSFIDGYLNDDLDQGANNSFELYCKDKGLNYSEIETARVESFKEYQNICRDAVSELLGEFGDEVLEEAHTYTFSNGSQWRDPEKTIATEVADIISDIDDDYFYSQGIYTV